MSYQISSQCPACGHTLEIAKYHCPNCQTEVSGRFDICRFCNLPPDLRQFVTVFIVNRGNIKLVEKSLGISYPTVRKELKRVIEALGFSVEEEPTGVTKEEKLAILNRLEAGEVDFETAMKLMEGEEEE